MLVEPETLGPLELELGGSSEPPNVELGIELWSPVRAASRFKC